MAIRDPTRINSTPTDLRASHGLPINLLRDDDDLCYDAALPSLIQLLSDQNSSVSAEAARTVGKFKSRAASVALAGMPGFKRVGASHTRSTRITSRLFARPEPSFRSSVCQSSASKRFRC